MEALSYLEINTEQFKALVQLPVNAPMVMLNLLKFKDHAPETGLTGAESYKHYMQAATPFFAKANVQVPHMGKPRTLLIDPGNENMWDKIRDRCRFFENGTGRGLTLAFDSTSLGRFKVDALWARRMNHQGIRRKSKECKLSFRAESRT